MGKKLNEKIEESSLERIRKVAEELKPAPHRACSGAGKVGGESRKNPQAVTNFPPIQKEEKIAPEINLAEIKTELSDLTRERLKLEKILQEMNNLKGRICQRIELIKTLERRKREIEKQLASLGKENPNFLEEVKNKLDNLREHIKPR
jgi:hypothetical protein